MSAYSDAILATSGLRGYWRLGEASGTNANDETANNNDGTYTNTPTLGVAGAPAGDPNTAVGFNGTDEYVMVPDATALDLGNSFTLECWVKRGRTSTGANEILLHKGALAYVLYITATSANRIVLHRASVGDVANSGSFGISDTTTWHHIVAGKNGSTRVIYLDGVDRTSLDSDSTMTDSAVSLRFATETPVSGLHYQGAMDEVAIYTGLLSAATVLEHYNIGRTFFASIGQATEADSAQVLTALRAVGFGQASETELAQAFSSTKFASLEQVAESDLAQAIAAARAFALGRAVETDEVQALTLRKLASLGQAAELDAARPITYLAPFAYADLALRDRAATGTAAQDKALTGAALGDEVLTTLELTEDG